MKFLIDKHYYKEQLIACRKHYITYTGNSNVIWYVRYNIRIMLEN